MGCCCGLVCGYTSKVVDAADDSRSPAVDLPCDEDGDILAVSYCPTEAKRESDVGVVSFVEGEATSDQSPMSGEVACRPE